MTDAESDELIFACVAAGWPDHVSGADGIGLHTRYQPWNDKTYMTVGPFMVTGDGLAGCRTELLSVVREKLKEVTASTEESIAKQRDALARLTTFLATINPSPKETP